MTQDLTTQIPPPRALTLNQDEIDKVLAAFAKNFPKGAISEFDLPRIKVSPGTALWLIPALEGDETAASVTGVILHVRDARAYFKSRDGGNVPPDCSSRDGETGHGSPGGICADCPLSQWESADNGRGQACRATKQLFLLRGESHFPELLTLPPTSIRPLSQYFLKLVTQGVEHHHCIMRIDLEKMQNAQGKPYGRASIKFLRRLTEEEIARCETWTAMAGSIAGRVTTPEFQD
jgi:hypothetical protein